MSWNIIFDLFNRIENKYDITKLHCLSCVKASTDWLEEELTKEQQIERAQVVYDYWLDTDIQISKISDIVCKYWKEYEKDEAFDIYDYVDMEDDYE